MADEYVSINCDIVFMTQGKALIDIGLAGGGLERQKNFGTPLAFDTP